MKSHDLRLSGVSKVFPGGVQAVQELDLAIEDGEFFAILGPSGCGKTTTLRMVAGLEKPSTGRIFIGERDVTDVPTHHRNVGVVFQSYALFPHLTVFQNIAFGLRLRGDSKSAIVERVDELLHMIRLPDVGDRMVDELSGGQQQRIALARALAPQPSVLLLDEPLSNLDLKLRQDLRLEIRRIQRELGTTTIFVTHDQGEALALADRVLVMSHGTVSQMGSPTDVYEAPANRWVASFLGDANIFEGSLGAGPTSDTLFHVQDGSFTCSLGPRGRNSGRAEVAIRPESVQLRPGQDAEEAPNSVTGTIVNYAYVGPATRYVVRLNRNADREVLVDVPTAGSVWTEGNVVTLDFPPARWIVLNS